MRLIGEVSYPSLHAARGVLAVVIEHRATCDGCGETLRAGEKALFSWDNKRIAQPSRLHIEGVGRTTIHHPRCRDAVRVPANGAGREETSSQEGPQAATITGAGETRREAVRGTAASTAAQSHSPTSVAAARAIAPATPNLRERVYLALRDAHGLTDEEGAELLAMPLNTYRPRRIELVEVGAVRDAGRTRPTHAGRQATVWEIV